MPKIIFISSNSKEVMAVSQWAKAQSYPFETYSEEEWLQREQDQNHSVDWDHTKPTDNIVPFQLKRNLPEGVFQIRQKSLQEAELEVIQKALNSTQGNVSGASRILNVGRATLYRKMKEHNINVDQLRPLTEKPNKLKKVA